MMRCWCDVMCWTRCSSIGLWPEEWLELAPILMRHCGVSRLGVAHLVKELWLQEQQGHRLSPPIEHTWCFPLSRHKSQLDHNSIHLHSRPGTRRDSRFVAYGEASKHQLLWLAPFSQDFWVGSYA